ncbi:MAG: bifunctional demethylmenaquinone methyltransferase/2-methoxy-6-polyprenyl-1,4-benzoquinol methylase UbiE [Puniceicoccaceae bacterium]
MKDGKSPAPPLVQGESVNRMFAGIAGRYDRANRFLSLGIDVYWRWRTVRRIVRGHPRRVVDLATGSGDIALALRRHLPGSSVVTGMDFCGEMLEEARRKADARGAAVDFRAGDCLRLPLEDQSVDACTIGFGLRNLEDRAAGLREMFRILRPGGTLLVLEFSRPHRVLRPFYYFYLEKILPAAAARITGDRGAYQYLGGTIGAFPDRPGLSREIEAAGFRRVTATPLTGGIVALHQGFRDG